MVSYTAETGEHLDDFLEVRSTPSALSFYLDKAREQTSGPPSLSLACAQKVDFSLPPSPFPI